MTVAAVLVAVVVQGCMFAREGFKIPPGFKMPPGHPELDNTESQPFRRLEDTSSCTTLRGGCMNNQNALYICTLSNCYVSDETAVGNMEVWYNGLLYTPNMTESIAALANHYSEDMCYWAFQTLPPPTWQQSNFQAADGDFVNNATYDDVLLYGEQSNTRMAALIGNGVFEGGLSVTGTVAIKNLCARGKLTGTRCDPSLLALPTDSFLALPAAQQLVKIKPGGQEVIDAVKANLTFWRTSYSEGHVPAMAWVATEGTSGYGWGMTGELAFKVVKCSEIPDKFKKSYDPDPVVDGEPLAQSAFTTWNSLTNLCPRSAWNEEECVNGGSCVGCRLPPAEATDETVQLSMTVAANVEDYAVGTSNHASVQGNVAKTASVDKRYVSLQATSGSVNLVVSVKVPAGSLASDISSSMTTTYTSAAATSTALGITVLSDPTVAIVKEDDDDGLSTGAIIGIASGGGVALLVIIVIIVFKNMNSDPKMAKNVATPAA